MAPPDLSSPPRVVRSNKRPAIYSPPHSTTYNRNQSEIALSWWSKKKEKITRLKGQLSRLTDRISTLEAEAKASADYISQLETELEKMAERNKNVEKVVGSVMEYGGFDKIDDSSKRVLATGALILSYLAVIMKKTQAITRLRVVIEALFSKAIFGVDATRIALNEMYTKYHLKEQRRVFLPWKLLRAMDLCLSGSLNYKGVELLRSVEGLGRYQRGIIPSRSQIQRASYELNDFAQEHIPFEKKESNIGEMFAYDYERFLRFILKVFKLHDAATHESIEICFTLDGAELCDGLSHLTAGIKITDSRAIDPRDGSPLSSSVDGIFGRIFKVQSRNYCFAMKTLLGKDCKAAYREFKDFFLFFERLKRYGLPASQYGPRLLPMEVWSPQDLSSIWKSLNTGTGARKNGNSHFCHLCPCTGNTIARYLVEEIGMFFFNFIFVFILLIIHSVFFRCTSCKERNQEKCFHWSVGDEAALTSFQQELERRYNQYLTNYGVTFAEIQQKSKITYDPCDLTRNNNKNNIDFMPSGDDDDAAIEASVYFNRLLIMELRLRNLSLQGTLEERRTRLKDHLKVEQQLKMIAQAIARGQEGKEAALMLIEQAIPCIMHLENRVGEKLITVLLAIGAERFQRQRGVKSLSRFANNIQHIVNTRILGSPNRPKQWRVPLNDAGDAVNKVSLSNKKTRLFIDNIIPLVEYIFQAPEDVEVREIWRSMIIDYRDALMILRQSSEYSDDEITDFQEKIDRFFYNYLENSGASKEGITNYLHMLGSGHVSYYMKKHKNLSKFSQQGWESLNEKVKLIFFNHTQRGGNYGSSAGGQERYYLRSIFLAFQREVMWISGMAESLFTDDN